MNIVKSLTVKKKKRFFLFSLALIFLGLSFLFGSHRSSFKTRLVTNLLLSTAQATENQAQEGSFVSPKTDEYNVCDFYLSTSKIFNWLLGISFAVAVLFMVVSGFLYILSVGDSGFMSMAKEGLKYSLIGFAICLTSWLAIHILFTVMGANNQGDWWTIQCDDSGGGGGTGQGFSPEEKARAKEILTNEVPIKNIGGRANPYSLNQLANKNINNLPQDKYFFIHGLGGQSVQKSVQELAKIIASAEENKKIVFAAVPEKDSSGNFSGTEMINLSEYFSSALNSEEIMQSFQNVIDKVSDSTNSSEGVSVDQKTENQLTDLMLELLTKSASQEIPVIINSLGATIPEFSGVWPEANWTGISSDGSSPDFKATSTLASGLAFEEGNGPFFYDPERNNNQIPNNQTHLQINLNDDGSLNTKDPISVLNVSPGVTEKELSDYLDQTINVLLSMDRQTKASGDPSAFSSGLADLLSRSVTEKLQMLSDQEKQRLITSVLDDEIKNGSEETPSPSINETKDSKINHYEDYWNLNYNPNKNQNTSKNEVTGGSGILPYQIKKEDSNQQISNSQANNLLKNLLNNQEQEGGQNNSTNGQNSSSGSDLDSGNKGGGNTSNGDWSSTSISTSGYALNQQEKDRLEKMIGEYLKEMNLNLPPEFVMCIIKQESNFKPEALNDRGEYSIGLMQLNAKSGTTRAALNALKKYAPETYQKLLKQHGSDAKIISTETLLSRKDPAGEKGMTNIALGIAYLKSINAQNRRGGSLQSANDWDNLAAGYNCGPAGCKGGHTFYSTNVTGCTNTMVKKRNSNDSQFKF